MCPFLLVWECEVQEFILRLREEWRRLLPPGWGAMKEIAGFRPSRQMEFASTQVLVPEDKENVYLEKGILSSSQCASA